MVTLMDCMVRDQKENAIPNAKGAAKCVEEYGETQCTRLICWKALEEEPSSLMFHNICERYPESFAIDSD